MTAAQLCRTLNRSRGSEIDLGIAACTMQQRTGRWTRNDAELMTPHASSEKLFHVAGQIHASPRRSGL